MIKKISICTVFISVIGLALITNVYSGTILDDAKILKIGTSYDGNSEDFVITFSSGTGTCSGSPIRFPKALAISDASHNRIYSTLLAAFLSGKTVRIFAYNSDDCYKATFVEIK